MLSAVMNSTGIQWAQPVTVDTPSARKRKYTRSEGWSEYKHRILELRKQNQRLLDIREIMLKEYGLEASISQYKHYLMRWGDKRNFTTKQVRYIIQQILKRGGRIPTFKYFQGGNIDCKKVSRAWERRDRYEAVSSTEPLSPCGIVAITPLPSPPLDTPSGPPRSDEIVVISPPPSPPTGPASVSSLIDEDLWAEFLDFSLVDGDGFVELPKAKDWPEQLRTEVADCPDPPDDDVETSTFKAQKKSDPTEIAAEKLLAAIDIAIDYQYPGMNDKEMTDDEWFAEFQFSEIGSGQPLWRGPVYSLVEAFIENKDIQIKEECTLLGETGLNFLDVANANDGPDLNACCNDEPVIKDEDDKRENYAVGIFATTKDALADGGYSLDFDLIASVSERFDKVSSGSQAGASAVVEANSVGDLKSCSASREFDFANQAVNVTSWETLEVQEAMMQYHIASAQYTHFEYSLAMETLERSLEIFYQRLGRDHEWSLKAQRLMGCIFRSMYRLDEAQDVFSYTAQKYEVTLGRDALDTRWTYYELASTYLGNYHLDKIWEPIWKAAASSADSFDELMLRQSSTPTCWDTLTLRTLLIALEVYNLEGNVLRATQLAKSLYERRSEFYGTGIYRHIHQGVDGLWAIVQLSRSLPYLGFFEEAFTILNESRNIVENHLRLHPSDPLNLEIHYRLNRTSILQGESANANAEELERQLLQDLSTREKLYPSDQVGAFKFFQSLALLSSQRKNYTKALEYHHKGMIMLTSVYGYEHPQTLRVIADVVSVLNERGLVLYARPLSHYALKVSENWFGPMDPRTLEAILVASRLTAKASGWDISEF